MIVFIRHQTADSMKKHIIDESPLNIEVAKAARIWRARRDKARGQFPALGELLDWAHNYPPSRTAPENAFAPWVFFLDLCGYSVERYGYAPRAEMPQGARDFCLLGDALRCFERHGFDDIYSAIEAIESPEPTAENWEECDAEQYADELNA